MKKHLSILLCAILMFSLFAGCGKGGADVPTDIKGTWEANVAIPESVVNSVKEVLNGGETDFSQYLNFEDLCIKIRVEFKEDGTYNSAITKESLEELRSKISEQALSGINEYIDKMVTELNLPADSGNIPSFDEQRFNALFTDELIQKIVDVSTQQGYYKAVDGKLYTAQEQNGFSGDRYEKYEFVENGLKIIGAEGMDENILAVMNGIYPITYKKVN